MSSMVIRPVQQDKRTSINLLRICATCFGRQFRPSWGDITKI